MIPFLFYFPTSSCLPWTHPLQWTLNIVYLMEERFRLPNLDDGHIITSLITSTISSSSFNRKVSPSILWMFDNGSSSKMISLPLILFIKVSTATMKRIIASDGFGLHKLHSKPRCTCGSHILIVTTYNLARRNIYITSLCMHCGVNPEIAAHIFLHYSFTLELWASERNRLQLSSWPSTIASLWADWRLSNISRTEVN